MKRFRLISLMTVAIMLVMPAMLSMAQSRKAKSRKATTTQTESTPSNSNTKKEPNKPVRPDLDQIRAAVTDINSPFYYPKLRAAYKKNDTVMTPEQYRYFYLGYMFQEDYNPYRESPFAVDNDPLAFKEKHTTAECDSIIQRAEMSLDDNPFDLQQMSFLIYALKEKRKDMRAKIWQYRLENILNAIMSTGTGETPEDAWFVITPDHEYALINAMNYTAVGYDDNTPGIDYIQVKPNIPEGKRLVGKQHPGFYFNVKTMQQEYDRKFGEGIIDIPDNQPVNEPEVEEDPDDIPAEE